MKAVKTVAPKAPVITAAANARIRNAYYEALESACRIHALARIGVSAGDDLEPEDGTYLLEAIRDIASGIRKDLEPIDQLTRTDDRRNPSEAANG